MKPERRNLLLGAVALVALAALGSRGVRRSTCAGGSCGVLLPGLSGLGTNCWAGTTVTKQAVAPKPERVVINAEH